ncbi:MAG: hypothetical protein KGJ60_12600 [Verrucomicrobiota bacterium]|nr:hypothetical protein [Verrucomicrobiota bacterium]
MRYFDYETIARQAGILPDQLARLAESFAEEELNDPMLAELHTMRACMAIKEGRLTIEEALADVHALAT